MLQWPKSISSTRCTLTDISFLDTASSNVKLIDCEWENISFINCQLADVTFRKVKLTNIRFYNVDFRTVRLQDVCFHTAIWRDHRLDNHLLGLGSVLTLLPVQIARRTGRITASVSDSLSRARAWNLRRREAYDLRPLVARPGGRLSGYISEVALKHCESVSLLQKLPTRVLDRIMTELYSCSPLFVSEVPTSYVPWLSASQTTYKTPGGKHLGCSTYLVAPRMLVFHEDWLSKNGHRLHEYVRKDICTAFLRVNRACHMLAAQHLYAQPIKFAGSAESCLAFLHDHRRQEHRLTEITTCLYGQGSTNHPPTDMVAWRRLFNVLVHEREDLDRVEVVLGAELWPRMVRHAGAKAVLEQHLLCDDYTPADGTDDPRSALQHVARLAGGKRWDDHADARVRFRHKITGSKLDPEKKAFETELSKEMVAKMAGRPALAKARYGSCFEKWLENSCYWKHAGRATYSC